ncbi:MAG: peptidoglycan-binding protein [Pseudomonadota bacterium]
MPEPQQLLRAELREITWDDNQEVQETGRNVPVQFNPETLSVAFSNKSAGGDQRGGSAIQFVGQGETKLNFEIYFDVTAPEPNGSKETDVRKLTEKVVKFITPEPSGEEDKFVPPGIRFIWGTFLFDGIVDSIDESLEFFSREGKPLRAKIAINISKQEIQFQFGKQSGSGIAGAPTPGTAPLKTASDGDSVQGALGKDGKQDQWQIVASANGIDNPRNLVAGTTFNAKAGLGAGAPAGFGATASGLNAPVLTLPPPPTATIGVGTAPAAAPTSANTLTARSALENF